MATDHFHSRPWWGSYSLKPGETGCWRIGALRLWLLSTAGEWRLASRYEESSQSDAQANVPCPEEFPAHSFLERRFGFGAPGNRVVLEPRAADRPLVWRPAVPLAVAPGEETTLYVRAPLWLALRYEAVEPALWEAPVHRLSDTWSGAPTAAGGYAYSADREYFLHRDAVPRDITHVILPIVIRNSGHTLLSLERLNLPVPFLSLFSGDEGIWTSSIVLERNGDGAGQIRVGKDAPPEAGAGQFLAGPRANAEKNLVFDAFKKIFG